MKVELILDRIEFNIIPYPMNTNTEPKAARFPYNKNNKQNKTKVKELLQNINNKFASVFAREMLSEVVKNQFGHPQIVQIGNEQWNYKVPSYVLNVNNIQLTNNIQEANFSIEAQALIFRVAHGNFDKYITFKVKRNWLESQGELEEGSRKFMNLIINELLKQDMIITAEIKKDKKSGYYLISKVFKK